jgi:hypothetical protein
MVRQYLDDCWSGYFITFMFNRLSGSQGAINRQMQIEIEGVYASFLTRLIRRPHSYGIIKPVLITCPDWPVPKRQKKALGEITTNGGLHHHGILLIPPASRSHRLKVSIGQHFIALQSYYTRDRLLKSVEAKPFLAADARRVTDYLLKGLKRNRINDEETLLFLPNTYRDRRPYRPRSAYDAAV